MPCAAATKIILGTEFKSLLKLIVQRLEIKWDKSFTIIKNHVNFRVLLELIRGILRCIIETRFKVADHAFKLKDSRGIDLSTL